MRAPWLVRVLPVCSLLLLLLAGSSYGQLNSPYAVWGYITNRDASTPAVEDVTLAAHIEGREDEVLTEDSAGSFMGVAARDGLEYQIELGNFPTAWTGGEQLVLTATNENVNPTQTYYVTLALAGTGMQHDIALRVPGITTNVTDNQSGEDGSTAAFTVVLDDKPTADVTITFRSDDTTEGDFPARADKIVTFTSANWGVAQTVQVIGQDDNEADGDQDYAIDVISVVSADLGFHGLAVDSIALTNVDDAENFARHELSSQGYVAGGTCEVTCQFGFPPGRATLQVLTWTFQLPAGWTVQSVAGDGSPAESGQVAGQIDFNGDLSAVASPVDLTATFNVPADATGVVDLASVANYTLDTTGAGQHNATPDPLGLWPRYHPADVSTTPGQNDGPDGRVTPLEKWIYTGTAIAIVQQDLAQDYQYHWDDGIGNFQPGPGTVPPHHPADTSTTPGVNDGPDGRVTETVTSQQAAIELDKEDILVFLADEGVYTGVLIELDATDGEIEVSKEDFVNVQSDAEIVIELNEDLVE